MIQDHIVKALEVCPVCTRGGVSVRMEFVAAKTIREVTRIIFGCPVCLRHYAYHIVGPIVILPWNK